MKDNVIAIAIIIAALLATVIHHVLVNSPKTTLAVQGFFYEQSGLEINVPEDSVVEVYDEYVLIVRTDGITTMVPMHRIHAIDGGLR